LTETREVSQSLRGVLLCTSDSPLACRARIRVYRAAELHVVGDLVRPARLSSSILVTEPPAVFESRRSCIRNLSILTWFLVALASLLSPPFLTFPCEDSLSSRLLFERWSPYFLFSFVLDFLRGPFSPLEDLCACFEGFSRPLSRNPPFFFV